MQTIGIGELQKNVGILTHLKEALTIIDKRKNKEIAVIYPIEQKSITSSLSSKYKKYAQKSKIKIDDLEKAKEEAMMMAMKEKYDFLD